MAAVVAAMALACGDPAPSYLELAELAGHQVDQVSTGRIVAADPTQGLVAHGWVIEPNDDRPPALVMLRERARLWFFSADGATTGVELHGGLTSAARKGGRRLLCRVNGEPQAWLVVKPQAATHTIEFAPGAVRPGWNYLQLSLRHLRNGKNQPLLSLRGLRFLKGDRGFGTYPGRARIEIDGDDLWMPADSVLDAVFEVPEGARFEGRLIAEAEDRDADPLELTLTITGEDGVDTELSHASVPAGKRVDLDEPLDRWTGSTVRLRTLVSGSGPVAGRWAEARVSAPGETRARAFDRLIAPAPVEPTGELGRPNIVVILLDAARADAFSPWGGPYPTPAIERLAAEGTRFERALAPSSWTGQAVPAVLTGFYPDTVGVTHWADGLSEKVPTLAELLGRSGYHTALWSQHPVYSRGRTLARGFTSNTNAGNDDRSRLPEIDDLFVEGKPTFAWIHVLPPHTAYLPPAPFRGRYSSWYQGDRSREGPMRNGFPNKKSPSALSADDRRYIRDRYHENVAFADDLVGRILEELERTGRYDNSLIAVISDHGEAFLEHGDFLHANRLYWELLHVPFVIKWPASVTGFEPTVERSISMVDLAPTLVAGLGLEGAERGFQGRNLLPAILGRANGEDRALYAITRGDGDPTRPPKRWIRLERDGWAVLWGQLDDRVELYDLAADPAEQHDLAAERPTHALLLLQELRIQHHFNRTLLGLGATDAEELDPGLVEELKALGYL